MADLVASDGRLGLLLLLVGILLLPASIEGHKRHRLRCEWPRARVRNPHMRGSLSAMVRLTAANFRVLRALPIPFVDVKETREWGETCVFLIFRFAVEFLSTDFCSQKNVVRAPSAPGRPLCRWPRCPPARAVCAFEVST
jgi:hypothetical protein